MKTSSKVAAWLALFSAVCGLIHLRYRSRKDNTSHRLWHQ